MKDMHGCGIPTTDEEAMQYLPDHLSAQALYRLCRTHHGMSIPDAMIEVLKACIPVQYRVGIDKEEEEQAR